MNESSFTCVVQCPNGKYGRVLDNTCQPCDGSCLTCAGPSSTDCTSCVDGSIYYAGICMFGCPEHYFVTEQMNCGLCHDSCNECLGGALSTNCTSCVGDRYFYQNQCLLICPNGLYPEQSSHSCVQCNESCATCSGPANTNCISCPIGHFLFQQTCLQNCLTGYYGLA